MIFSRIHKSFLNHLRALLFALGELLRNPLSSSMTLIVIGIAMAFPAGMYALLNNVQKISAQWYNSPTISLYLKTQLSQNQLNTLINTLSQHPNIAEVKYISPEQGLQDLKQQIELENALQALPKNPLPGVLVVTPNINYRSPSTLQELVLALQQLPDIETSQLDTIWLKRLYELMTLGERITYGLMLLFSVGVVLIVGNTMRLATQSHRQEIMVLRLVGATHAFIRRPLLYRGALYGILGGIIACILVSSLFWWLKAPAQQLAASYHGFWHLRGLNVTAQTTIIIICGFLGLMGSWLSVSQHLRAPEDI